METLEQIKARAEAAVPGAALTILNNETPAAQHSLLVDAAHAFAVARFLRDDAQLQLDFCSNATGVDWPEKVEKIKTKVKKLVDGVEKEVEETSEKKSGGYLEAVRPLMDLKAQDPAPEVRRAAAQALKKLAPH